MSLFCDYTDFSKIKIDISSNIFTHLNKTFRLQFIKKLYNRNNVLIKLFKLYECVNVSNEISNKYIFVKDIVCKIIYKHVFPNDPDSNYDKSFYDEINYNLFLEKNMPNFRCNILYYYIKSINSVNLIEYGMFFNYLGETLEKFNISSLDKSNKIKLIIDLLQQCIELNNLSLYHSDIKPDNICIECLNKNKSEYKLSLIDYGLLYGEKEYNNLYEYNTTITSGSPEYYNINKIMDSNNSILFPKELFDKSQHFAVAGIIFGIIVNNSYLYFTELYKHIKKHIKYSKVNFENCDLLTRFTPYNDIEFLDEIKKFIINKLDNINNFCGLCSQDDHDIRDIIINMLNIKYNTRLSFEEIKIFFENKLLNE